MARPAPEFPTGTVTFLFTDIEGSTRLLQRLGDAYPELLPITGAPGGQLGLL